jgi:predicted metalloprotease with PDZ domain
MDTSRGTSFASSLGFAVKDEGGDRGTITQVGWNSPAFKAGITPDMQLLGVNDQVFSVANLRQAILQAENDNAPIKLLLKRDKELTTVAVDYHGGMRYSHLERVESTPDILDLILAPVD